ncbi:hypothetical protein CEXT_504151 [Caerostris extrusa]|uniref:Uncharacterized protein n=1 Tax=Caerostris extrusa TaxID=172846 RepID=A0AAV4NYZ2_CAEEX|nr:hypothetical protein CEXT_504151 [Caerostris extrusa]
MRHLHIKRFFLGKGQFTKTSTFEKMEGLRLHLKAIPKTKMGNKNKGEGVVSFSPTRVQFRIFPPFDWPVISRIYNKTKHRSKRKGQFTKTLKFGENGRPKAAFESYPRNKTGKIRGWGGILLSPPPTGVQLSYRPSP